ncbi:MAG: FHA domain-containing protein [Chthoniobacterales bacterium]|nr:FHA domain-containing protein [Chthoniobacterales bacterium]
MRLTVYFPDDNPAIHNWTGENLSIGRLADNDVSIDDDSISSRHAEISGVEGATVLRDLDSTNGTFLNREQITGEHPLVEGDEIYFGGVRTVFMEPSGAEVDEEEVTEVAMPDQDFVPDAGEGGHPDGFRPLSPLPPEAKKRDTLALAAWGSLGLGVAAVLYALVVVATS